MDRATWWIGGVGLSLGYIIWKYGNPIVAAQIAEGYLTDFVGRGSKLSDSTLTGGIVQEVPEVLNDMASAVFGVSSDVDTYSLARMGRSEGVDGMEYRMHVALNDLDDLQSTYGSGVYSSITALMIHSKVIAADGHYSEQSQGKRYATSRDPYQADYALADKVRADHAAGNDPTGGALKFVDKSSFAAQPGATQTYDDVVAQWAADGLMPQNLPGATSNFVVFVRA